MLFTINWLPNLTINMVKKNLELKGSTVEHCLIIMGRTKSFQSFGAITEKDLSPYM